MNLKNMFRLGWVIMGMAICLTASSCKTCREEETFTLLDEIRVKVKEDRAKTAALKQKTKDIIIPEVSFRPPATIVDAVEFFTRASIDCDDPKIPLERRGISFVLKLPEMENLPVISAMTARNICLYDALKLVCEVTGLSAWFYEDGVIISPNYECCMSRRSYYVEDALFLLEEEALKSFFAEYGVSWPTGSTIKYWEHCGQLHVVNYQENLSVLEDVLDELRCFPALINVELQVVAFQAKDIRKLEMDTSITKEALMKLQTAGKSKPVTTVSAVVEPEEEAIVKAVQEVTYPTEANVSEYGLEPQNFTIREVGTILKVTPKLEDGGLIRLTLRPQWITLERWEQYPVSKNLAFRQPVFNMTEFDMKVTVEDGDTILLGTTAPLTANGSTPHS